MHEDDEVPFTRQRDVSAGSRPMGGMGPQARKAEGAAVIDITAMIKELESNPESRQRK